MVGQHAHSTAADSVGAASSATCSAEQPLSGTGKIAVAESSGADGVLLYREVLLVANRCRLLRRQEDLDDDAPSR